MSGASQPLATTTTLAPCEQTGKPCSWVSEEWYADDGQMESWDDFCVDCGRWRDWSKDECPTPTT